MSISKKVALILVLGIGVMMLLSVFVASRLFSSEMDRMEIEKATLDMERIGMALTSETANLNEKLADWASWDDSYQFVQDKNQAYITSNLETSASFESLRLSFIIFVNSGGEIVYKVGYNQKTKEMDEVPDGINRYLANDKSLLKFNDQTNNNSGMMALSEGLMLISARPILTSNSEGPSKGTIIFGRFFDDIEINNLAQVTKQPEINIYPLGDLKLKDVEINEINENNLEGRGLIKDIFNNPIAYYSVNITRDIHLQGVRGVRYLTTVLVLISFFFSGLMLFLLGKLVINPMNNIAININQITHSKNSSARVNILGNDEFAKLSKNINLMLDSLESSKNETYTEAEKSKTFFDVVSGIVVVLDRDGIVTAMNKKGLDFLGYLTGEVFGKNWFDNFIPEEEKSKTRDVFNRLMNNTTSQDTTYCENSVLDKSGKLILIGWHNSLLKDQNGKVQATVSHGEDITEKKREEEKNKKQKDESDRLNQLMMGRELKMVELKQEVRKLKMKGGDIF